VAFWPCRASIPTRVGQLCVRWPKIVGKGRFFKAHAPTCVTRSDTDGPAWVSWSLQTHASAPRARNAWIFFENLRNPAQDLCVGAMRQFPTGQVYSTCMEYYALLVWFCYGAFRRYTIAQRFLKIFSTGTRVYTKFSIPRGTYRLKLWIFRTNSK
jgi:hypothetical protein